MPNVPIFSGPRSVDKGLKTSKEFNDLHSLMLYYSNIFIIDDMNENYFLLSLSQTDETIRI